MPDSLYIPPDALRVFLESFEGPLDLLLHLIRRHNLDVLDIKMAELARQYMAYVELMEAARLELATEYLPMAGWLVEIKSRLLLPAPPGDDGEEIDPRVELTRRLVEYERMKRAAERLDALPRAGRDFQFAEIPAETQRPAPLPAVGVADLVDAWARLLLRARRQRRHAVAPEPLSVQDRMDRMLRRLEAAIRLPFDALFDARAGAADLVVTFLALLELLREGFVGVDQVEPFGPITVNLCDALRPVPG